MKIFLVWKCRSLHYTENKSIVRWMRYRFLPYSFDTLSYLFSTRCRFLWDTRHISIFPFQRCRFPDRTENMPRFRSNQHRFLPCSFDTLSYLLRTRCRFRQNTNRIPTVPLTTCTSQHHIRDMSTIRLWRHTFQHCSSSTCPPIHRQSQHCIFLLRKRHIDRYRN